MTAFNTAWDLLKTDMRLPAPTDIPAYTDPHANLAFYGSTNPDWWRHRNPFPENMNDADFAQSIRDEIAHRKGEMVIPPLREYEVGDFSEAMQEGIDGPPFGRESAMGVNNTLHDELRRASLIEAMHDAGIHDVASLENILDEEADFDAEGLVGLQARGSQMKNDRGWMMRGLKRE
tara:strand:+ start:97 stop:624 length:528 start_codon:yes stop_codon:yes gene_type:complete